MSITYVGLGLMGLGVAVFVGGPTSGFRGFFGFLDGYRNAKAEKREATLEQKAAYWSYVCYVAGATLVMIGSLLWLVRFSLGE